MDRDNRRVASLSGMQRHKDQGAEDARTRPSSLAVCLPSSADSTPEAIPKKKFYCAILNRRLTGCWRVGHPLVVLYRRNDYLLRNGMGWGGAGAEAPIHL